MSSRILLTRCVNELQQRNVLTRALATKCPIDEDIIPKLPEPALKTLDGGKSEYLQPLIKVDAIEDVGLVSGVPEEHIKTRTVRIYQPPKSAMQSGTNNIQFWQIDFDNRERWENNLMGWCSTGDPLSNIKVDFTSTDEAIAHCKRMNWRYYIQKPNVNEPKARSYGTNFAWNKRTRVSTK